MTLMQGRVVAAWMANKSVQQVETEAQHLLATSLCIDLNFSVHNMPLLIGCGPGQVKAVSFIDC